MSERAKPVLFLYLPRFSGVLRHSSFRARAERRQSFSIFAMASSGGKVKAGEVKGTVGRPSVTCERCVRIEKGGGRED